MTSYLLRRLALLGAAAVLFSTPSAAQSGSADDPAPSRPSSAPT